MISTFTAVRQGRRPTGAPSREDFVVVTGELPALAEGQALIENLYLSVDPYMRELMEFGGWERGFGLEGRALGRVVSSRDVSLPEGAIVFHRHSWATHAVISAADARIIEPFEGVQLSAYLGILGGTGLTAYVGLTRIARLQPGEDLFVSAAAGGVGTATAHIARLLNVGRLIGSAGSSAKVAYLLDQIGFDAAFDYHAGPITEQLAQAAPEGIDVYLDNVGGEHLEAAINALRPHGRVAWCGAISQYNNLHAPPPAPRNLFDVVDKSLRIEGFLVRDHRDAREEFERFLAPHIRSGRVPVDETVVDGFDNLIGAFLGMLRGENIGKMLVRIA